jgi:hypothetical protein
MALEDFKTEKEYPIGSVKSRKKVENIKLNKAQWKHFAGYEPDWVSMFAADLEKTECKALVGLMDEIIEEGIEGVNLSDEELDRIEEERDNIIRERIED